MLDNLFTPELVALVQIIVIDIVMSGDNAIIIGLAAAGLPPELRKKAIIYGIVGATVLRIIFASVVVQLLSIIGIMLVLVDVVQGRCQKKLMMEEGSGGSVQ